MLRACDLVAYLNEETLTDVVTAAEVQDAAIVARVQGAATDAARRCNCCWRYTKDAACVRPRNQSETLQLLLLALHDRCCVHATS